MSKTSKPQTLEDRLFGAAMTSSWAISEFLQDKAGAVFPDDVKKAKKRYDGRMRSCAKRFGFESVQSMKDALRGQADAIAARGESQP